MKEVPLTRGYVALVDDEDYERIMHYKWYPKLGKYTTYAYTSNGIYLHRFVLNVTDPKTKVDHRDFNGLNCQKSNFRYATTSQNGAHARKQRATASKFKGVTWDKTRNKWMAQVKVNYKNNWLGHFIDELAAAEAYDRAARHYFGEFAHCNFEVKDGATANRY